MAPLKTDHPEYMVDASTQVNYAEAVFADAKRDDITPEQARAALLKRFGVEHDAEVGRLGSDLAGWGYLQQWLGKTDVDALAALLGPRADVDEFRRLRQAESHRRDPEHYPAVEGQAAGDAADPTGVEPTVPATGDGAATTTTTKAPARATGTKSSARS